MDYLWNQEIGQDRGRRILLPPPPKRKTLNIYKSFAACTFYFSRKRSLKICPRVAAQQGVPDNGGTAGFALAFPIASVLASRAGRRLAKRQGVTRVVGRLTRQRAGGRLGRLHGRAGFASGVCGRPTPRGHQGATRPAAGTGLAAPSAASALLPA